MIAGVVRNWASSDVFQAVADPTRRRMLALLAERERPVMDIASHFDMTQPSVSEHLRVLRDAGLVEARKQGRQRVYRLDATPLQGLAEWVRGFEEFWNVKLDRLGRYLRKKHAAREKR